MADNATGQEPTPQPQADEGQPQTTDTGQPQSELTPEQLRAQVTAANKEAADYRRKLREAEGKLTATEKAQAEAAEKQAAEQGEFKKLYEAEKAKAAETEARLRQIEFDNQRKDAAQAAGIPSLWQRLQGDTAEALAEDAAALAALMQPAQPANGQATRQTTMPTPAPQGANGMTPEERRAKAARTF